MKNAFAHNAFAASGGISQTAADARYVLKAAGSFTGLTGAGFRDGATYDVSMAFASSTVLDAGRSITWDVKNASHELKFTAASIVTFPAGTNTLLGSAVANTITANGAASTPALHGSGTIFTGGTATTTKPYWLIEPAGTTSTGWSTAGTLFGVNAPSGFVGDYAWLGINGVANCRIGPPRAIDGMESTVLAVIDSFTLSLAGSVISSSRSDGLYIQYSGTKAVWFNNASVKIGNQLINFNEDSGLARVGAAELKFTNGSSGYGSIDAAGFKVGGVAGTSGTITAASTVTVVNGIVTVIA